MDRKVQYKHHSDTAEAKRDKRRVAQNELRKEKRDEVCCGKRVRLGEDDNLEYEFTVSDVQQAACKQQSKSENRISHLKLLRQAFSQGTALIDAFISVDNSVACLVGLLSGLEPNLQLEAAWCLTNMAAGTDEQALVVIKYAGAYLVTYLSSGSTPMQDQCSWAIGNLAGGGAMCREMLCAQGAVIPLVNLLKSPVACVVQSAAFALSNLARDTKTHQVMVHNGIVSHIASHLVFAVDKLNVTTEVAWLTTYLAASGEYSNELSAAGIPGSLVSIATGLATQDIDSVQLMTPVMRCLGNIVCGASDDQLEFLTENKHLFQVISTLLDSQHLHLRKETLWVLSNITALKFACLMVIEAGAVPHIAALLSDIFDIRKEATLCLCNIASNGDDCCRELYKHNVLVSVIPALQLSDAEIVHMALCLVEMILQTCPEGSQQFEENRGLDALEVHEYSNNETLRTVTCKILENYFYQDD